MSISGRVGPALTLMPSGLCRGRHEYSGGAQEDSEPREAEEIDLSHRLVPLHQGDLVRTGTSGAIRIERRDGPAL
jgi:hypothetical protein